MNALDKVIVGLVVILLGIMGSITFIQTPLKEETTSETLVMIDWLEGVEQSTTQTAEVLSENQTTHESRGTGTVISTTTTVDRNDGLVSVDGQSSTSGHQRGSIGNTTTEPLPITTIATTTTQEQSTNTITEITNPPSSAIPAPTRPKPTLPDTSTTRLSSTTTEAATTLTNGDTIYHCIGKDC